MDEETSVDWRARFANFLMGCFVVAPGVGVGVAVETGWGVAVFGVCAGVVAWILGSE